MKYVTKPVTISRETRKLEFFEIGDKLVSRKAAGLYRRNGKTWASNLTLWKQDDGSYKLHETTTILNRAGYYLIGWANDRATSKHNSAQH